MIELDDFKKTIPTNNEADVWHSIAVDMFAKYDINTVNRVSGFMAQCGHESADFKVLHENLNYSWQALRRVFSRYFPSDSFARKYHRIPKLIANRVYNDALRINKLGNVKTGDGWLFRGRGLIQLTGRWNYEKFGKSVGMTAEEAAAYCGTKRGAFESACWYWSVNNLNRFCDQDDIVSLSKAVNGGSTGLTDRISRYTAAKKVVKIVSNIETFPMPDGGLVEEIGVCVPEPKRILMRGSKGDLVKRVQRGLKIIADGDFGPNTERAVRSWQRINRYTVTGRLDEVQIKKILGET